MASASIMVGLTQCGQNKTATFSDVGRGTVGPNPRLVTSGKPWRGLAFLRTAVALAARRVEVLPGTGADGPTNALIGGGTLGKRGTLGRMVGGGGVDMGVAKISWAVDLMNQHISIIVDEKFPK